MIRLVFHKKNDALRFNLQFTVRLRIIKMELKQSNLKNRYFWIFTVALTVAAVIVLIFIPPEIKLKTGESINRIYFADNISIAHREVIDSFNREYRGKIEVVPVDLPFTKFSTNERKELLARSLRSRSNRIDVLSVDIIWVPRFARWCDPLDKYFGRSEVEQVIHYILGSCYYNGKLYAMPFYNDIGMMYYRRDIIDTLPDAELIRKKISASISWEDFISLSRRFSDRKNPFYLFAADNFEGLICSYIEGLASLNQDFLGTDSFQLNTPASRKTLQLLVDLVGKYKMTPAVVTKYDEFECYIEAIRKDALFFRGWPGMLRHYRTVLDSTEKFQYLEKAPLPHFADGKPAFVFGGWNLMMSKNCTQKDAAIKFIKFLLRQETQKKFYQIGGYLPVIQSVYDDTSFCRLESDLSFYRQLMEFGVHRPYNENYTKISDILSYHVHLAIKKEISVSLALARATELIKTNYVLIK